MGGRAPLLLWAVWVASFASAAGASGAPQLSYPTPALRGGAKEEPKAAGTGGWGQWRAKPPSYEETNKVGKNFEDAEPEVGGGGLLPGILGALKHVQTPGIKWQLRPERTKIKLRKRIFPLGLTRLTVGADYDPIAGEWSIKTSWKDTVIGGHLNIHGTELAMTKDFRVDDRNALSLKAAFDWHTKKSLIGFTLKPMMGLNAMSGSNRPGFSFRKRVPLTDNLEIELDSVVEIPEATYTTSSSQGVCLGIGDFCVDLRELNMIVEL